MVAASEHRAGQIVASSGERDVEKIVLGIMCVGGRRSASVVMVLASIVDIIDCRL